jgi:hypothetical protein
LIDFYALQISSSFLRLREVGKLLPCLGQLLEHAGMGQQFCFLTSNCHRLMEKVAEKHLKQNVLQILSAKTFVK